MSLLITETIKHFDFDLTLSIFDYECGYGDFNFKWERDVNGLIKGSDGDTWTCQYYSVGQLNKGHDMTVYQAQKEFNRDCHAFDVGLCVTVSKNNIELTDSIIITTDYNYNDCELSELLKILKGDHFHIDHHVNEAKQILSDLLK